MWSFLRNSNATCISYDMLCIRYIIYRLVETQYRSFPRVTSQLIRLQTMHSYIVYIYIRICVFRVYLCTLYTYARRIRENAFYILCVVVVFDVPKNNNGVLILIYLYVITMVRRYRATCCKRVFAGAPNETRRRWNCRWAGVGTRELWPDRVRWSGEWFERSSLRGFHEQHRYGIYMYLYILYPVSSTMLLQWRIQHVLALTIILYTKQYPFRAD
jgi:hypothetical protein